MTVRERVLSAKVLLELQKNEEYANLIGIYGNMRRRQVNESKSTNINNGEVKNEVYKRNVSANS